MSGYLRNLGHVAGIAVFITVSSLGYITAEDQKQAESNSQPSTALGEPAVSPSESANSASTSPQVLPKPPQPPGVGRPLGMKPKTRLTFEEWLEKFPERKALFDLNHDGTVDQNEKREYARQLYLKRMERRKIQQQHRMPKLRFPRPPHVMRPVGTSAKVPSTSAPSNPASSEAAATQ